eukprot:755405-Karenia_brevis.AAC.1
MQQQCAEKKQCAGCGERFDKCHCTPDEIKDSNRKRLALVGNACKVKGRTPSDLRFYKCHT